jgi:hypothetical protein
MTSLKLGFQFSKWILYSLVFFLTMVPSCKRDEPSSFLKLKSFFEKHGIEMNSNYKYIFFLTEIECPTCNKDFALFLSKKVKDPNALFVIEASGSIVDISCFENSKSKNIVFDNNSSFLSLKIIKKSGTIFLSKNNIDTIVPINIDELPIQLSYFSKRTD